MFLASGQILNNRYQIIKLLGYGGFGAVYQAKDLNLDRLCAVKENRDIFNKAQEQFKREAKILAELSHPHLPRVTDHFIIPDQGQYLVMDYIEGEDMQRMLEKHGTPLPEKQVIPWITQIFDALIYLHTLYQPVIHRDIKPANIIITPGGKAVLVDFGIAKEFTSQEYSRVSVRAITPGYSSPEQYSGNTSVRSDIYSLGATLYALLTGKVPPASIDILNGIAGSPAPVCVSNPVVSGEMSAVVEQAMKLKWAERFDSMNDFKTALLRSSHTGTISIIDKKHARKGLSALSWITGLVVVFVLTAVGMKLGFDQFVKLRNASGKPSKTEVALAPSQTVVATLTPIRITTSTPTEVPSPTPMPSPIPTLGIGSKGISNVDQMRLVYVPSGDFLMGLDTSGAFSSERPQHKVSLDAFWIDQTEVTNKMYAACVEAAVCKPPKLASSATRESYFGNPDFADFPVDFVDWSDAKTYCDWAGRRLPTEAEWEKAARGTGGQILPWGENVDCTVANYWEYERIDEASGAYIKNVGCASDTMRVGSFPDGKSAYGALDMFGNVREWVTDWFDRAYYKNTPENNPLGPSKGSEGVIRGGWGFIELIESTKDKDKRRWYEGGGGLGGSVRSFAYVPSSGSGMTSGVSTGGGRSYKAFLFTFVQRISFRDYLNPKYIDYTLGFRCAQSSTDKLNLNLPNGVGPGNLKEKDSGG